MRCHAIRKLSEDTLICDLEHEHLEELHHDLLFAVWWKEDDSAEANVIRIPLSPPPYKPNAYIYEGPLRPTHYWPVSA